MTGASALYVGGVFHTRLRPRRHRLKYRVFWLMLDLDEIDALDRRLKTFSRGRFNLMGFYDRDHGDGAARSSPAWPRRGSTSVPARSAS